MLARRPNAILRLLEFDINFNRLLISAPNYVLALKNRILHTGLDATNHQQPGLHPNRVGAGPCIRFSGRTFASLPLGGEAHLNDPS